MKNLWTRFIADTRHTPTEQWAVALLGSIALNVMLLIALVVSQ